MDMFKVQERKIRGTNKPEVSKDAKVVEEKSKITTTTTTTPDATKRSQSRTRILGNPAFSFGKLPNRVNASAAPAATATSTETVNDKKATSANTLEKDEKDASQASMSRNSFSSFTGLFGNTSRRNKCFGGVCILFVLLPLLYLFGYQRQQPQPVTNILWDAPNAGQVLSNLPGHNNNNWFNGGGGNNAMNSGGGPASGMSEWMRKPCDLYCDYGCQLDEETCSCSCPTPSNVQPHQPPNLKTVQQMPPQVPQMQSNRPQVFQQPQQHLHHQQRYQHTQQESRQLVNSFIQFIALPIVIIVFLFGACMLGRMCAGGNWGGGSRRHSHRGRSRSRS